ncbi:unnamed protein product [Caretta caretta]
MDEAVQEQLLNASDPKSNIALERSKQRPDQASKVTMVFVPVPEESLSLEQLQNVLGPYSEELFDDLLEEQSTMELEEKQKRQK